jgi:DnaJ-class molecular chaperone
LAAELKIVILLPLQNSAPNHYATLGLDHRCTEDQIRSAYRILAKKHHPDLNNGSRISVEQTQALNSAYEILSDPDRREAYDHEQATAKKTAARSRSSKASQNISEDVHLGLDELLRGTTREVRINDPGQPGGPEHYELVVPPETAPGTRFRLPRDGGGYLAIKIRLLPHYQFKARGSDLRCDLKISFRRAAQGGEEMVTGASGSRLRVKIEPGVERGEIIRLPGEGLPRPRGGRGDLLVRIMYRPEVRITRPSR